MKAKQEEHLKRLERVWTWDLIIQGKDRSHIFRFNREPTRNDFLSLCQIMPWTSCWNETLIPAIKACKWPTVEVGFKRNQVEIGFGKDLVIERSEVWKN